MMFRLFSKIPKGLDRVSSIFKQVTTNICIDDFLFVCQSKLGRRKLLSFLMFCVFDGFFPSSMQHVIEKGTELLNLGEDEASKEVCYLERIIINI
jgi:hypothetical protein